jgi:hypothetical protein
LTIAQIKKNYNLVAISQPARGFTLNLADLVPKTLACFFGKFFQKISKETL